MNCGNGASRGDYLEKPERGRSLNLDGYTLSEVLPMYLVPTSTNMILISHHTCGPRGPGINQKASMSPVASGAKLTPSAFQS